MVVTPLAKILMLKQHQDFHIRGLSSQGDRYLLQKEKVKMLKMKSTKILCQNESASFTLSSDITYCGGRVEHSLNTGLL